MLTPLTPAQPPAVPPRLAAMREAGADLKALTRELIIRHGPPPAAGRPDAPPLSRSNAPEVLRDLAARSDGPQKDRLLAIAAKLESRRNDASDLSEQDQRNLQQEWSDLSEAINTMSTIIQRQDDATKQIVNNIKG